MHLGIIAEQTPEGLQTARDIGISYAEFCVNVGTDPAILNGEAARLAEKAADIGVKISSVGHWGERKLDATGIIPEQLAGDKLLIDAAAKLGSPVFCTGCNRVEGMSLYDNYTCAIEYFQRIIDYAGEKGIKTAAYNCSWENFICCDPHWDVVMGKLDKLYIKYDVSHCLGRNGDYLFETKKWAKRFAHVHIKGTLKAGGEHVDDPPAGLDCTNWGAFLGLLYAAGYDGVLSIEPHSATWQGRLGMDGVKFTINHIRPMILGTDN